MPKVFTVSQFVEAVRGLLRETLPLVTVQGEVTGYQRSSSQYVFFELKDERSRVKCFHLQHEVRTSLEDGMEVKITGWPSLFVKSGGFHLRVTDVELVGEGALRKAFEETKKRLEREGLFRPERKRSLPRFPESIGLVTSREAAAYTDVLRILRNRWPLVKVKFVHVKVQGAGAVREIVKAIELFSAQARVELLIVTRGGGSLEDLQAFNDEGVARAIFASPLPVVVGVGHERDVTIADYVADVRASTPSNAAERVVPDRTEVLHRLEVMAGRTARAVAGTIEVETGLVRELTERMSRTVEERTARVRLRLTRFSGLAGTMVERTGRLMAELDHLVSRLGHRFSQRLADARAGVTTLSTLLQSLSPLAILKRGYTITFQADGRVVKRSRQLDTGQSIRTRFGQGEARSTVTSTS
ncbi:MAG: exodeoxyribonuclease VII large subunit [Candidatus Kerfeldbacteria bacterium]|nr:exodeoxyribonuclease VII large subunit [Candidatus Kerfeldbacteria bacterium]